MSKRILVIGGTRLFSRLLVEQLLGAGHRVAIATRGRAADLFGDRVVRIRVDRRDAGAMEAAFAREGVFDVIYDQVCYSPLDAAIAARTFGGRVGRYVMASTIEVYEALYGRQRAPMREEDVDLAREAIDLDFPWHDPAIADAHYGRGKRQAEALIHRGARPAVSVRIGHVLAGLEDFTGRLAHYVRGVIAGEPLRYAVGSAASSFISAAQIADFLVRIGDGTVVGPINAASVELSALDLYTRAAQVLGVSAEAIAVADAEAGRSVLSPFDHAAPYVMDTARARALGYEIGADLGWLDELIRQHGAALA